MYDDLKQGVFRQRELLAHAEQERQAARLRALRKAHRRAERAQQRLDRAQSDVRRMRSGLDAGA